MKISRESVEVVMATKGMTYAQVAELSGMGRPDFSQVLKKGRCTPRTAGRIANALGVSVQTIIDEEQKDG